MFEIYQKLEKNKLKKLIIYLTGTRIRKKSIKTLYIVLFSVLDYWNQ